MHDILSAVLLGIVEGLTEFLPVSSTGHLIIVGDLLGLNGPKVATFEVAIQLGAILAVVVLYWDRFWGLLRPRPYVRFAGLRGIVLLGITSLPASLLGLVSHHYIKEHLFSPAPWPWPWPWAPWPCCWWSGASTAPPTWTWTT